MHSPTLTVRRAPRGERDIYVQGADNPIGSIVPEMNADGSPTLEWHGRVTLRGKPVSEYASDTRRISGVVGTSSADVLRQLQAMADGFYED